MSEHRVNVDWERGGRDFMYETYSRDHRWTFEGGSTVMASAAPAYRGNPELVDPEAALVAALSSCHMLSFLALAARRGLVIEHYADDAVGYLEKNQEGKLAVTRVVLRPRIELGRGASAGPDVIHQLHEKAHEVCFIASSVKTEVTVEAPQPAGR
jgi:organic hydroperoxide reductase OsmC/OhrA